MIYKEHKFYNLIYIPCMDFINQWEHSTILLLIEKLDHLF